MSDPVDDRLERLSERTSSLPLPPGFETRVLARLRVEEDRQANARDARWDVTWSTSRGAMAIALIAAAAAVSLAIWHDDQLTDAVTRAPEGFVDPELREP